MLSELFCRNWKDKNVEDNEEYADMDCDITEESKKKINVITEAYNLSMQEDEAGGLP